MWWTRPPWNPFRRVILRHGLGGIGTRRLAVRWPRWRPSTHRMNCRKGIPEFAGGEPQSDSFYATFPREARGCFAPEPFQASIDRGQRVNPVGQFSPIVLARARFVRDCLDGRELLHNLAGRGVRNRPAVRGDGLFHPHQGAYCPSWARPNNGSVHRRDAQGKVSIVNCSAAIALAFTQPRIAFACRAIIAIIWLIPVLRIERALNRVGCSALDTGQHQVAKKLTCTWWKWTWSRPTAKHGLRPGGMRWSTRSGG